MTLASSPTFSRPLLLPPLTSALSPSIAQQMKRQHECDGGGASKRHRTMFPCMELPRLPSMTHQNGYLSPEMHYPPQPTFTPTSLPARPMLPPASTLLHQPSTRISMELAPTLSNVYVPTLPEPSTLYKSNENTSPSPSTEEIRGECLDAQCHNPVKHRGYCKVHGGARRCDVPGCPKGVQGGNLCIGHGGGKRCRFPGCSKATQSQGLCKAHGGGVRCKYDGCNKSSQGGGFCRRHGGGKRCSVAGCPRGAQRGSTCAQHGGKAQCMIDGCVRADRGGGYCEVHRKDKVCRQGYCNRLARIKCEGYCTQHHREFCISSPPQ